MTNFESSSRPCCSDLIKSLSICSTWTRPATLVIEPYWLGNYSSGPLTIRKVYWDLRTEPHFSFLTSRATHSHVQCSCPNPYSGQNHPTSSRGPVLCPIPQILRQGLCCSLMEPSSTSESCKRPSQVRFWVQQPVWATRSADANLVASNHSLCIMTKMAITWTS